MKIKNAMILAAGLGERMRPLTDARPKPLLCVAGRSFLDRIVDALLAYGVQRIVVNHHYLGEQIVNWAQTRPDAPIILSDESHQRLETGGGVKQALPLLGAEPFFTFNGDMLWQDGSVPMLQRMGEQFNQHSMDALLLLQDKNNVIGQSGAGDYAFSNNSHASSLMPHTLTYRGNAASAPYMFAGVTITHPRMYETAPDGAFSQKLLWDQAEKKNKLYGLVHDAAWYHVATPDDLKTVSAAHQ